MDMTGGGPTHACAHEACGAVQRARRRLLRLTAGTAQPDLTDLHAVLRFDSATTPPASQTRASTRQLLFEAGPFEIELHTRAQRNGWAISGQVLGPTEATDGEVLLIGTQATVRSRLSELLEFRFAQLPAGRYRLELHLTADGVLHVDARELGP